MDTEEERTSSVMFNTSSQSSIITITFRNPDEIKEYLTFRHKTFKMLEAKMAYNPIILKTKDFVTMRPLQCIVDGFEQKRKV